MEGWGKSYQTLYQILSYMARSKSTATLRGTLCEGKGEGDDG